MIGIEAQRGRGPPTKADVRRPVFVSAAVDEHTDRPRRLETGDRRLEDRSANGMHKLTLWRLFDPRGALEPTSGLRPPVSSLVLNSAMIPSG